MTQTGVYFTEVESHGPTKYVPRSVQIDLEAGVCNHVSMRVLYFWCYVISPTGA